MDIDMLDSICNQHNTIITIEEGVLAGGFGSAVSTYLHDHSLNNTLYRFGIPDRFVEHGNRNELLRDLGLTPEGLISILKQKSVEKIYDY